MKNVYYSLVLLILILGCAATANSEQDTLLIFTKTNGFRHSSIEKGVEVIKNIASNEGFDIIHSEDSTFFQSPKFASVDVVVFLNTTGNILNEEQQKKFMNFIRSGGGFIGIHAAADTEFEWPWYGKLIGGYFNGHPNNPNVREANIQKLENHFIVNHIPERWQRADEWYNYKDVNPAIKVLLNLDESSYEGGDMGEQHPIVWYHEYDGGKIFYSGMGHTAETYDEEPFRKMIENALEYVAGH